MDSLHNTVSDLMDSLRLHSHLDAQVTYDNQNPGRWIVRFTSKPGTLVFSLLEVEVMENEDTPVACVLHRINMTRRTMTRIMDELMAYVDMPELINAPEVYRRR